MPATSPSSLIRGAPLKRLAITSALIKETKKPMTHRRNPSCGDNGGQGVGITSRRSEQSARYPVVRCLRKEALHRVIFFTHPPVSFGPFKSGHRHEFGGEFICSYESKRMARRTGAGDAGRFTQ